MSETLTLKQAKRAHRRANPGLPFKEWIRQEHKRGGSERSLELPCYDNTDGELKKILAKPPIGSKPDETLRRPPKPKKLEPHPLAAEDVKELSWQERRDQSFAHNSVSDEELMGYLENKYPPKEPKPVVEPEPEPEPEQTRPVVFAGVSDVTWRLPTYRGKNVGLDNLRLETVAWSDETKDVSIVLRDEDDVEHTLPVTELQLRGIVSMIKHHLK